MTHHFPPAGIPMFPAFWPIGYGTTLMGTFIGIGVGTGSQIKLIGLSDDLIHEFKERGVAFGDTPPADLIEAINAGPKLTLQFKDVDAARRMRRMLDNLITALDGPTPPVPVGDL